MRMSSRSSLRAAWGLVGVATGLATLPVVATGLATVVAGTFLNTVRLNPKEKKFADNDTPSALSSSRRRLPSTEAAEEKQLGTKRDIDTARFANKNVVLGCRGLLGGFNRVGEGGIGGTGGYSGWLFGGVLVSILGGIVV